MGEFRRSRSKVWWSNYYQEDDDADEAKMSSLPRSTTRFSWRSLPIDNTNRNSSSSPSNGSQKSQDSGFSDSESSSPSSCSSKESKSGSNQTEFKREECTEQTVDSNDVVEESNIEMRTISKLPETPINRIPRPCLIRRKKREAKIAERSDASLQPDKSKCDTISSYLADCYFPITNVLNVEDVPGANELPHSYKSPLSPEDQRYLETVLKESRTLHQHQSSVDESNSNETESRTCFIVDELPKENFKDVTASQRKDSKSLGSSLDTTSSSSSDEYKVDDTVRYVEKKDCLPTNERCAEEVKNVEPPCINVDLLKVSDPNESRFSNLDLSHLPEPTHTSTPKKEDTKLPKRIHKKCRRSTSVVDKVEPERHELIDAPVLRWLGELKLRYEPECMTTLQAKSMMHCCKRTSMMMISESTSSVQTFQNKTKLIANAFLKLYDNLSNSPFEDTEPHLRNLINSIMEFIINYSQLLPRMEATGKENLLKLMDMCDRLRQVVRPHTTEKPSLLNDINILEKFFSRFVDSVLTQQIMLLTAVLETPNSDTTLLNALSGIATLSSNTSRTCELITHFNGIQNLLAICVQSSSASVRKAALRALAVICQNATTIRKFENVGGIEILSELLSDVTRTEAELLEVISVLVQITAPWIEDDHIIKGLIYHLHPTLNALTRLIGITNSCETLLLSAAALANISFIEPQAVFMLLELDTAGCLLTAVRKLGIRASIFLQEQVATLIANMSAVPETRSHLAQQRAVGALLCFLQVKHSPVQTAAEIAAAERLQHKSAIALSRLCTNTEISKQVVELQGVNRLVRLCREERERNYSDGVLVACLASLRKITANCGNDSINKLNAKELVEPRLVDSFLLYSSRQESYV